MTQSPLLPALFLLASFPAFADGGQNSCVRLANDIVEGTADGCDELCPQALQFDNYDYRAGLTAAFESRSGLSAYFEYLDRSSIIGSAAEAHACSVHALILHWGDDVFSSLLSRQSEQSKNQAVSLLDYTALQDFEKRFPKTYALAEHE
jgi:hypothetical protein